MELNDMARVDQVMEVRGQRFLASHCFWGIRLGRGAQNMRSQLWPVQAGMFFEDGENCSNAIREELALRMSLRANW